MTIDISSRSVLKMSAFCEGGSGGEENLSVLYTNLEKAKVNLMGRIVKVYRNESRQRMKPKDIIYHTIESAVVLCG